MQKRKEYSDTRFAAGVLRAALHVGREGATQAKQELTPRLLEVAHDDSLWSHDTLDEYFADYRKYHGYAYIWMSGGDFDLIVECRGRDTKVSVKAPTRIDIEKVFEVFETHAADSKLPPTPAVPLPALVVFIGHGRSQAWRDLKDHLQDKHGIQVEAYETGARAGHTIRDVLEDMTTKSSFAVLVMTGEDEQADGGLRARQNVIHEAGLFQGKLGFARAIVALEEGVEEYSNVHGVQYIPFSKGNIKEIFGEVLATLRREGLR